MPSALFSHTIRRTVALTVAMTVTLFAVACERAAPSAPKPGDPNYKPVIVATTGMIADVAANIAGTDAKVITLMGEGIDPHLYKPTPGDLRTLESADLILYNGLHLEGKLAEALESLGKTKRVMPVTSEIPPAQLRHPPEFEGHPDPHVWFDVSLWSIAADSIRESLAMTDPPHAPGYAERASKYKRELADLHVWCKAEIDKVPADKRLLVTAHDAFGYFGRAYGLTVRGIQGISTDSEASIRDINALVDTLVKDRIPAVFIESSVPRKTIDALIEGCHARGHTVVVGGELFSDAMGAPGTPDGTYIGMVRHNVRTIVHALAPAATGKDTPK